MLEFIYEKTFRDRGSGFVVLYFEFWRDI